MPKRIRKSSDHSDGEEYTADGDRLQHSGEDYDEVRRSPRKKKLQVKKPRLEDIAAMSSPGPTSDVSEGAAVAVHSNAEGEKYVSLGKKKRATARSFKGIVMVDIREYYGDEGEEKPGKKGISLTLDQWNELKTSTQTIDSLLSQVKK